MRWSRAGTTLAAAAAVVVGLAPAVALAQPATAPTPVSAVPAPGQTLASPGTDVTLRGADAAQVAGATLTGSQSGVHPFTTSPLDTEKGVVLDPEQDLAAGETVTVSVPGLAVAGAEGDGSTYTFAVQTPGPALTPEQSAALNATAAGSTDVTAAAVPGCTPTTTTAVSRPDLGAIPGICTTGDRAKNNVTTDKIFQTSGNGQAIYDAEGNPIWFNNEPNSIIANFERFDLDGQPVIATYKGSPFAVQGSSIGEYEIRNTNYDIIHTVRAGNGLSADLHEVQLTKSKDGTKNTALIGIYQPILANSAPAGGPGVSIVVDYVVQEVELDTANVLFEWHAADQIPFADSHQPVPGYAPWDWIHGNSIQKTSDGNYIVSGRHTWATYKISSATKKLIWTLGGDSSNFKLATGNGVDVAEAKPFCWQHDFRQLSGETYTLFDNAANIGLPNDGCGQTRGITMDLTPPSSPTTKDGVATFTKVYRHDPAITAGFAGSMQQRTDGSVFLGYGGVRQSTLFNADGSASLMEVAQTEQSYRAYLQDWHATPSEPPVGVRQGNTVYASWNGATEVASWRVLAGDTGAALTPVATVPRTGFETAIPVPSGTGPVVVVQALDGTGKVLGQSGGQLNGSTTLTTLRVTAPVGPVTVTPTGTGTGAEVRVPDINADFFLYGLAPSRAVLSLDAPGGQPTDPIPATATFGTGGSTVSFRADLRLADLSVLGFSLQGFTGPTCTTSTPVDVVLTSPGDARSGSPLTATYTIPPFSGCNGYDDAVSGQLSGTGNTLQLKTS